MGAALGTGEWLRDVTEDIQTVSMSVVNKDATKEKEEGEKQFYKEAFEAFDWNRNGNIPTSVSKL